MVFILLIYGISFRFESLSWLLVIGSLAFIISFIYLLYSTAGYFRRRSAVEQHLKSLSKYTSFSISLTELSFEMALGADIFIEKWESIKNAEISPSKIVLYSSVHQYYLLPAKSMKADEFENVAAFIRRKVKFDDIPFEAA